VETTKFHVPGEPRPLSDSAAQSIHTGDASILVAAGGIDPATITFHDSFQYFLGEGVFAILLIMGGIGLISMLVALPLLTGALRPLTSEAAAIRPDAPDRRIDETQVPRELLPLVRSFNAALDRLASELVRRKRFVTDVAHELRTPLAILTLLLDAKDDEQSRQELRRIASRMTQLVGQMLDVERLSLAGRERKQIDLASLAEDVVADMAPMAMAAGYDLSLVRPSTPVPVTGDSHALERAIGSLIGNAVAHAGGEGVIQVRVTESGMLDVADEGPGVPEALRSVLFEPFTRERWDRDGCGLGLHLTREIMRAHGGDAISMGSDRGATFRLAFPAQD
jgi:signal transduction histidine kinase